MTPLYWHLALTAIFAFGGFATALIAARFGLYSDVMLLVFSAGSVGAVINNYYRLAKLSAADNATAAELDSKVLVAQMYVSILVSGILAFIIYGLCLSGLLAGSLFPVFNGTLNTYMDVSTFLHDLAPKQNIDTAKVLMWAFIAGFSERLIPNVIDRLINEAEALRVK